MPLSILCDSNPINPTIAIGGDPATLRELGHQFVQAERFAVKGTNLKSAFFPTVLDELAFAPLTEDEAEALLNVELRKDKLLLSGGTNAAQRLGKSLLNFFSENVSDGDHFHLDYFVDNGLLAPTNYHLIFECEAQEHPASGSES